MSDTITAATSKLEGLLGENASLLQHECKTIDKSKLHLPGPDFIERAYKGVYLKISSI